MNSAIFFQYMFIFSMKFDNKQQIKYVVKAINKSSTEKCLDGIWPFLIVVGVF